jgi:outer membrane protein
MTVSCIAFLASQDVSAQTFSDTWQFTVGLGAVDQPTAPGSATHETIGFPLFSATYDRYFIGSAPGSGLPFGVGAYLFKDDHWLIGAAVGESFFSDTGTTTVANVFAVYGTKYFIARSGITTDIGGHGQGTRGSFDFLGKFSPIDNLTLTAGPGLSWADGEYMQKYYGVNAVQSADSGLPTYTANGGINALRFKFGAQYNLTPKWTLGAQLVLSNLHGDAGKSPLTESRSQDTLGVAAAYHF